MTSFYLETLEGDEITLDEDSSRHAINVLRMKTGNELSLTDGKGQLALASIIDPHKKKTRVHIINRRFSGASSNQVCIAISLVKNASRFEWFLEKATEIGVNEIIPLICDRTEKDQFRHNRMLAIVVSAMLQSQQSWLPTLHQPTAFKDLLLRTYSRKLIAHCLPSSPKEKLNSQGGNTLLAIGPEGDFSTEEINTALANNFAAVTLGETRLRTETAGLAGAVILKF